MAKNIEIKKRKKKWVVIYAPKEFKEVRIAESLCYDPKDLIGKTLKISLGELLRDQRSQNIVILKIVNTKNDGVVAEIFGYEVLPAHIKRVVRASRNKIIDSFVCETNDKIKVRIKPLILTRYKTKRSILAAIRKTTRNLLTNFCKEMAYSEVVSSIITNKLQGEIRENIKKIYPVAICEIGVMNKIA